MSATVVFATPISSWSDAAAAAIRSRVACWASARALSSYLRFWVDIAFIEVYSLASRSLYTSFTERPHAMQTTSAPKIVGPHDGRSGSLGSIGVRFMIGAEETHAGGFSLVEHPMPPRALAAPLHLHTREDEHSYVLEGRVWPLPRCTSTPARTSARTSSRGGWARCSATTSSMPRPAPSSTSRATSGTRSG